MKPARVAFVLPYFDGGGSQRVALNLLRGLPRERFAPELVMFDARGPLRELAPADAPILDLGGPRLRSVALRLLKALRARRPDVLFSTFGYVNLALLALRPLLGFRPRLVIREGNTPSESLPRLAFGSVMAAGYRLLYRRADCVICQSRLIADELQARYGVPAERLAHLANPIEEAEIRRRAEPAVRHPGPGLRFVAAGRLTAQKGFDRLLEMMAATPESAHLTILGEGAEEAALRAQARRLGVEERVLFAGFVADPWPRFAGADAFLLPSRWEGMPNAALEALACGVPVIATPEAGGFREVAEEAAAGAATLAEAGPAFTAAMLAARPHEGGPRPSLLPARFEAGRVLDDFCRQLAP